MATSGDSGEEANALPSLSMAPSEEGEIGEEEGEIVPATGAVSAAQPPPPPPAPPPPPPPAAVPDATLSSNLHNSNNNFLPSRYLPPQGRGGGNRRHSSAHWGAANNNNNVPVRGGRGGGGGGFRGGRRSQSLSGFGGGGGGPPIRRPTDPRMRSSGSFDQSSLPGANNPGVNPNNSNNNGGPPFGVADGEGGGGPNFFRGENNPGNFIPRPDSRGGEPPLFRQRSRGGEFPNNRPGFGGPPDLPHDSSWSSSNNNNFRDGGGGGGNPPDGGDGTNNWRGNFRGGPQEGPFRPEDGKPQRVGSFRSDDGSEWSASRPPFRGGEGGGDDWNARGSFHEGEGGDSSWNNGPPPPRGAPFVPPAEIDNSSGSWAGSRPPPPLRGPDAAGGGPPDAQGPNFPPGGVDRGPRGGPPPPNRRDFREPSYYGPGGAGNSGNAGGDFRRSPSQRGRPMFVGGRGPPHPPNLGMRQGSFPPPHPPGGGFGPRRDPRFEGNPPELPPRGGPPLLPPGGGQAGPPFGRPREWTHRSSPAGNSPPNSQPGGYPMVPAAASAAQSDPHRPLAHREEAKAAEAVIVEKRLDTAALGDDQVERAEKVIALLADLMDDPSIKNTEQGELSILPTKAFILRAVAKMDTRIKNDQKTCVEKQTTLDVELVKEQEARDLRKLNAETASKKLDDERREEDVKALQLQEKVTNDAIMEIEAAQKQVYQAELAASQKEFSRTLMAKFKDEKEKQEQEISSVTNETATTLDAAIQNAKAERDEKSSRVTELKATLQSQGAKRSSEAETQQTSSTGEMDLVSSILAENRRRAAESHLSVFCSGDSDSSDHAELENLKDPKEGRTNAEWADLTRNVTGLADALYHEPCEAPYYNAHMKRHAEISEVVVEFVRDKRRRLNDHWTSLAEEYECRRLVYKDKRRERSLKMKQRHSVLARNTIIPRQVMPITESPGTNATQPRPSTKPYRRARRGNEVRSEYEQEQIIAEIAAKEAMEKRIASGGCAVPRQVGNVELTLTASFYNTFTSQKVDFKQLEEDASLTNMWTDTEKCIFLDRFLQHPKDFRKIASFLRNKTTKDCVGFYYDSKQSIPYKRVLREHIMRRKRRGDYHVWDATMEAALSVGAVVKAGSQEKPLQFFLPDKDCTYHTRLFHPMKREIFHSIDASQAAAVVASLDDPDDDSKSVKSSKKSGLRLFVVDANERRFVRAESPEPESDVPVKKPKNGPSGETAPRRVPKKWTAAEKRAFAETLDMYGCDWDMLSQALPNKSREQIQVYYDGKKTGKGREKKGSRLEAKDPKREETRTPPVPPSGEAIRTPSQANREADAYTSSWAHQLHNQAVQSHQQSLSHHTSPVTMDLLVAAQARQQLESRNHSGTSTPDPAAEHFLLQQFLLQQQQQQQQHAQSAEDAALLLLQHHNQSQLQQQQLLSNLLPLMGGAHTHGHATHHRANSHEWSESQQLQQLLQLQQQQQQQQQHHHHHQQQQQQQHALSSLHPLLAGFTGSVPAPAQSLAGLSQHFEAQNQGTDQLSLARQLLAIQAGEGPAPATDVHSLLARSLQDGNIYPGPGPGNGNGTE